MLHQFRFLPLGLGLLSSLLLVRPLSAQTVIEVASTTITGRLDSQSACPQTEHDPDAVVIDRHDMAPLTASSQASSTDGACISRGTSQTSVTFYQLASGALQISGSGSVSTFGSVPTSNPPLDPAFAVASAEGDLTITVELSVNRWTQLSFAGTLSIGTVTAVGSPEASSAHLSLSWELVHHQGRQIVLRSIELGSTDQRSTRQDINYSTIVAAPGTYTLRIVLSGTASADLQLPGATGWTCAGTYGLAITASAGCVADWDQNLVLDSRDFFEFINAFMLEAADFNQDAVVDSRDFFDFISAFMQGCE